MRAFAFAMMCLGACLYAFARGGGPERVTAGIFLTGLSLSLGVAVFFQSDVTTLRFLMLGVDTVMLASTLWVALYADRYWPLWMSAMQVTQALSHLPKLLIPQMLPNGYGLLISLWGYPMIVLLIVATWRHQERLRRTGSDPSWTFSARGGRARTPVNCNSAS